mgnify:CR=1 FL=1
MTEELLSIKNAAISFILEAETTKELEEIKLQFLGKSGTLTAALKGLAKLPSDKRPEVGVLANEVKHAIEEAIAQKAEGLKVKKTGELKKKIDITEPGTKPSLGHLHLITQAIEEITTIFSKLGFSRVRYPEIEWDWYAFEGLAKYLITEHDFTAGQIAEVWDLEDGCGGAGHADSMHDAS